MILFEYRHKLRDQDIYLKDQIVFKNNTWFYRKHKIWKNKLCYSKWVDIGVQEINKEQDLHYVVYKTHNFTIRRMDTNNYKPVS